MLAIGFYLVARYNTCMNTKKRVGLDFDDVLFSCAKAVLPFHNSRYGTNHTKDHVVSYNLHDLWKCSKEESYKRIVDFYDSEEHASMEPIVGAIESIHQLSEKYELFIITARPPEVEEVTKKLLKHFQNDKFESWKEIFKKIHFVGTVTGNNILLTKADICKHENIDIFVEDNLNNALSIASVGIPSLLLDQPWNKDDDLPDMVKRVYSWEEIVKEIDKTLLV